MVGQYLTLKAGSLTNVNSFMTVDRDSYNYWNRQRSKKKYTEKH